MRNNHLGSFLLLVLLAIPQISFATSSEQTWQKLRPNLAPFNDPFKQLTQPQLDDLGYFVALSEDITLIESQAPNYKKLPELKLKQTALEQELQSQNINVNYLLSQRKIVMQKREQAATATNPEIINSSTKHTVSGYLVPIEIENNAIKTAFLVKDSPYFVVAHQHHVPQPNQTIYVDLSKSNIMPSKEKVTLSGLLNTDDVKKNLKSADNHEMNYHAVYKLENVTIIEQQGD
ncbi:DUF3299 domain-containing protein [Thalassomonas sp. M1454]|uniref:DUF3299 domain-containing protein n=1 Tax=Thalassomonas sp. M1454 TaxID=2594477 RepID=UPI00117D3A23|nr:DUF3299 domain-containing protein [Thalassomonas sp. M1454]TRX54546.1 DUF3299 domain-containing protein [Thalassomonas sp. M1454]